MALHGWFNDDELANENEKKEAARKHFDQIVAFMDYEMAQNAVEMSTVCPNLPADVVEAAALSGLTVYDPAFEDITDMVTEEQQKQWERDWNKVHEVSGFDEPIMGLSELLIKKPGYVVDLLLEAGVEELTMLYRAAGYAAVNAIQSNRLRKGYIKEGDLFAGIQISEQDLVNYDPVNAWKKEGFKGLVQEYSELFSTAKKQAGATIWTETLATLREGKPLNIDPDRKFIFQGLKPEDDERYRTLLKLGYEENEAKNIYYKYAGVPIRAEGWNDHERTSLFRPNQIMYKPTGGRKLTLGFDPNNYLHLQQQRMQNSPDMFAPIEGNKMSRFFQMVFRGAKNLGRSQVDFVKSLNPGITELDEIQPSIHFSNGRVTASEIVPPGTPEFTALSGGLDAITTFKLDPTAKGLKGLSNLRQSLRTIHPDVVQEGIGVRRFRDTVFKPKLNDIIERPDSYKLYEATAVEPNIGVYQRLFPQLPFESQASLAATEDALQAKQVWSKIWGSGYLNETPVKGADIRNAVSRAIGNKSLSLRQSENVVQRGLGQAIRPLGNPNAAYRPLRSKLAKGLRDDLILPARNKMRFMTAKPMLSPAEIANPLDELLSFSGTVRSAMPTYMQRIMSIKPDDGLSVTNFDEAAMSIRNHYDSMGADVERAEPYLRRLLELEPGDLGGVTRLAIDIGNDTQVFLKGQGVADDIAFEASRIFETSSQIRAYGKDSLFRDLPFVGMREVEEIPYTLLNGEKIMVTVPSASGLVEMASLKAPLPQWSGITKALSKVSYVMDGQEGRQGVRGLMDYYKGNAKALKDMGFGDYVISGTYKGIIPKGMSQGPVSLLAQFYMGGIFKPLVLMRAAWFTRVFLEEQARMAVSGLDTMFVHPFRYITWINSHNSEVRNAIKNGDVKGLEKFRLRFTRDSDLKDVLDWQGAMNGNLATEVNTGRKSTAGFRGVNSKFVTKDWVDVKPGEAGHTANLQHELIQIFDDPVGRYVAKNHLTTQTRDWFKYSDEGKKIRERLVRNGGDRFEDLMTNEKAMDAYLDYWEARIRSKAGGFDSYKYTPGDAYSYKFVEDTSDVNLRNFAGTGKAILGKGEISAAKISRAALSKNNKTLGAYLEGMGDLRQRIGVVKAPRDVSVDLTSGQKAIGMLDAVVDVAFEYLMTKPNTYLSRSVAWKQNNWAKMEDLMPRLNQQGRLRALKEARDADIPNAMYKRLQGASKKTVEGVELNYDEAEAIAKAYALHSTKLLLYDAAKKHNISAITANIFPFPEVYIELATTWGKLFANNPASLARGNMIVRGAESSGDDGFFFPDPNGSGEEMFAYPGKNFLTQSVFGPGSRVQVQPAGYVAGINMLASNIFPGVAPLYGYAANKLLPKNGIGDEARKLLFGDFPAPDTLVPRPAWAGKLVTAFSDSPKAQEARAATTNTIYNYAAATGYREYFRRPDGSIDEVAMMEWANDSAAFIYAIRGISQFFAPTGFTPRYYIEDKDGQWWASQILANEFYKIREETGGDTIAAYNEFFGKYGIEHPYLTASTTISPEGRRFYTEEGKAWEREYGDLMKELNITGWYLQPESPFDDREWQFVFEDIKSGKLKGLSKEQNVRKVNDTLGWIRYTNFTQQLERSGVKGDQLRVAKALYRQHLREELPGYLENYGVAEAPTAKEKLFQIQTKWAKTPGVKDTEVGKAVLEYLEWWSIINEYSTDLGFSEEWWYTSTDDRAVVMRQMAIGAGKELIKQTPDFEYVFRDVFQGVLRDDILEEIGVSE